MIILPEAEKQKLRKTFEEAGATRCLFNSRPSDHFVIHIEKSYTLKWFYADKVMWGYTVGKLPIKFKQTFSKPSHVVSLIKKVVGHE